jgi:hypothetical protein
MDARNQHLDGNAAAGLLEELFTFDITIAEAVCNGCQAVGPLGTMHVYSLELGAILRCPSCGNAVLRISRLDGECWLDLRGMSVLRVMVSGSGSALNGH